jgi:hypothetical protein
MPFIKPKNFVAAKLETTSGTAISVGASDFNVRIFDVTVDPEIEMYMNQFASGRHSMGQATPGKKKCHIKFKVNMQCGSALGTAPTMGKFFKACGATETLNASTSVIYAPAATNDYGDSKSLTMVFYLTPASGNSHLVSMKGCMGNCVITMDDLGKPLVADFDFLGAFTSITDAATIALTSPDTSLPPAVIGSAITVASIVQKVGKFKLDFGNTVELDYDPADASGYFAAYIANREPKISLDPRIELLATDPVYTRWAAGTQAAFSLATSVVSSQKITIAAPKIQLLTNKLADRNGSMTYDQEYSVQESSGNDEWSISITA